ncbi:hypothetical protein CEXT_305561 [Caerostris extrusa]|uniref:Secreted protein n=1 Tax=Caerostris extrusa TaxID=172846 RepID=A0AAV4WUS1_CAEEX|nr:hypothetical protein CEXT_305561 [Caerostris extrusa]
MNKYAPYDLLRIIKLLIFPSRFLRAMSTFVCCNRENLKSSHKVSIIAYVPLNVFHIKNNDSNCTFESAVSPANLNARLFRNEGGLFRLVLNQAIIEIMR